jgi:hypothetical protein
MLDYCLVAVPVVGLAINAVAGLLAARARPGWGLLRCVAAGFAAGLVAVAVLGGVTHSRRGDPWQEAVTTLFVNLATYAALAYCFFAFINLGKTSIRIRIFDELRQSGAGLSGEELASLYDYHRIVELRLARLLNKGQVVKRDGRYFLGGFFLWFVALVVRTGKWVVMGKTSEFQGDAVAGPEGADEGEPERQRADRAGCVEQVGKPRGANPAR